MFGGRVGKPLPDSIFHGPPHSRMTTSLAPLVRAASRTSEPADHRTHLWNFKLGLMMVNRGLMGLMMVNDG